MSTVTRDSGTAVTQWREVCDKCGNHMDLLGSGRDFERWECPWCHQVVGIDRDPKLAYRFQLHRGYPWRYTANAFRP